MQDCADQIMNVWLNLPNKIESLTEHQIKGDKTLSANLVQQAMKGIAKTEEGDQVPFMCIRVHVIRNQAMDDGEMHSMRILNTFRMNGKWQVNLSEGDKPSFMADHYSEQLLAKVKNLFSRGSLSLPMMHIQAA